MPEMTLDEERARRRRKAKKRKTRNTIIITTLVVLLICAIGSTVFMIYMYKDMNRQAMEANAKLTTLEDELSSGSYLTTEEANALAAQSAADKEDEYLSYIRGTFESGGGTLTILEELYPNQIITPYSGGYAFCDIDNSLKMKTWDSEAFTYPVKNEETDEYEGRASYDDGSVQARVGVDVSKFQGDINWNKVKNDGIEYAYMRLGYRGYEEGNLFLDSKYEDNIEGCNEAGLDCGVYFFTEAKTVDEAIEEADYCIENLEGYHVELPIVIDVETSAGGSKSRTYDLTSAERTEIVKAFCDRVESKGYDSMIYGNLNSMMLMLDYSELEDYDKWFAYYRYPLRFPYDIKMWQYTDTGEVDGIKGNADINLMFY